MGKYQKQTNNQSHHKQNNHSNQISKNKNYYDQKTNQKTYNQKSFKNKYSSKNTNHQSHHNSPKKHQQQTTLNNSNSHLLTESLFKIIPQGQYEDKFAALNSDNQQQINHQHQSFQNQPQNQQIQEEQNNQQPQQFDQEQQQDLYDQQQQEQQNQHQQNQMNNEEQPDSNNAIKLEINKIVEILANITKLGQGKSKQFYSQKLKSHAHLYYGYNNELIDHFLNFFSPAEMIEFFQANTIQTPLSIRTNTLKIKRKQLSQLLIQRGVNLDLLAEWSKVGMKIYDTKVPIGATPQYLAGYYTLQSGSSLLSVLALDPQQNQKILDLASAPGGKTSYISQIMKNTGSVVANDLNKERLRALRLNLNRLGVSNTLVTCRDGRKYSQIFPSAFDRVLLDAPCSNLGIISKKPSIKTSKVLSDIIKNSDFQKQLLLAAIDCTKIGGVIVYSTSSVSPLQNEQVINYAIKNRFIKIVEINDLVKIGDDGLTKFIDQKYHSDLKKTKRIYPHKHNLDGFYIAKLTKISQGNKQTNQNQKQSNNK